MSRVQGKQLANGHVVAFRLPLAGMGENALLHNGLPVAVFVDPVEEVRLDVWQIHDHLDQAEVFVIGCCHGQRASALPQAVGVGLHLQLVRVERDVLVGMAEAENLVVTTRVCPERVGKNCMMNLML